jgi:uncharacterized protein YndB with AHSA1/START domain
MSAHPANTSPISKTVLVECSTERAFDAFTARMAEWWPLQMHSVFEDDALTVVVEPRIGGEVYEVGRRGEHAHWGTVRAWEPPGRVVLSWHVNPDAPAPTEIEVTFAPTEGGTTLVTLEHRGWEALGPQLGPEGRRDYEDGWDPVLLRYAEAARG